MCKSYLISTILLPQFYTIHNTQLKNTFEVPKQPKKQFKTGWGALFEQNAHVQVHNL